MSKRSLNISVMVALVTTVTFYNVIIYTQGSMSNGSEMSVNAIEGEKIWQDNNCVSCHQFYGLGGYLGPDLTNVTSDAKKSKAYLYSVFSGGVGAMPEFDFTSEEKDQLYEFLRCVDKTGYYPVKDVNFSKLGWGKLKYK